MMAIGGYIFPHYEDGDWSRFKSASVYFAGPGIALLIFFGIYAFIGFENFLNPSMGYLDLVLQGIALSTLTSVVINLIPSSAITEKGESANDGLNIIYSLFRRRG